MIQFGVLGPLVFQQAPSSAQRKPAMPWLQKGFSAGRVVQIRLRSAGHASRRAGPP
jgi:hypothetical protein